jgi:hypothetical protein
MPPCNLKDPFGGHITLMEFLKRGHQLAQVLETLMEEVSVANVLITDGDPANA